MRRKRSKKNNIGIAISFFVIVILFIFVSFLGKAFSYLSQSKFDDRYPFTLSIESSKGLAIASLFSKQHSISILEVSGKTSNAPSQLFAIPIEGRIKVYSLQFDPKHPSSFFLNLMLKRVKYETNLTMLDIARAVLFTKTVDANNIHVQNISVGEPNAVKDKVVSALFSDPDIVSENLRIEVVNATGVSGLGNRIGRFVSNIGGNIVFVSTSDTVDVKSEIYYFDKKSYTVDRLSKVLSLPAIKISQKTISDVTIRVGKDKASAF